MASQDRNGNYSPHKKNCRRMAYRFIDERNAEFFVHPYSLYDSNRFPNFKQPIELGSFISESTYITLLIPEFLVFQIQYKNLNSKTRASKGDRREEGKSRQLRAFIQTQWSSFLWYSLLLVPFAFIRS